MKQNKKLLIMMACALGFIVLGYWWVERPTGPIEPGGDENPTIAALTQRIEALSKQPYCEDSCKELTQNIIDAGLVLEDQTSLNTQLNRAKLFSLVIAYNHKKNEDCANINNRAALYMLLISQSKLYPDPAKVNPCLENYQNIAAFNRIASTIAAFKKQRFSEARSQQIQLDINRLYGKLSGCVASAQRANYLSTLADFANKEAQFIDREKHPNLYKDNDNCTVFAGYDFYLNELCTKR
jgi:hypothetical protein